MLLLVVDDDALSRELITLLLTEEGYEVESFASGEAAVNRVSDPALLAPDVILADMQMPGLTGDALASALRATLQSTSILLAMSGSQPASPSLSSFDGFLLKPFQMSELQSMIAATHGAPGSLASLRAAPDAAPDAAGDLASAAGATVLDEDIYSKLAELMPAEQLGQMYALCVGDARKRIVHMRALAAAADDVRYRAEAHTVKGGSGMIGARQLYDLAAAAERDGIPNTAADFGTSSVTAALAQLSLACDRLERILVERTRE